MIIMIYHFVSKNTQELKLKILAKGLLETRSLNPHMRYLNEYKSRNLVDCTSKQLRMRQDEACVVLCRKSHKKHEMDVFRHMIDNDYRIHWLLDGLPVAVRSEDGAFVTRGYPVGFVASIATTNRPQHYLFNHVRIIVKYFEMENGENTIVGFEVSPFSIKVSILLLLLLIEFGVQTLSIH